MRPVLRILSTLVLVPAAILGPFHRACAAQSTSEAEVHLAHVLEASAETPDQQGLLTLALADAELVREHAALAGNDPTNIDPMIRHARHVLHALDPAEFPQGPGSGFGVGPAVHASARHIGLAAAVEDAPAVVREMATPAIAAAEAIAALVEEAVAEAHGVLTSAEYMAASARVTRLQELGEQIVAGVDTDGDGEISIEAGEAGLEQLEAHVRAMTAAD